MNKRISFREDMVNETEEVQESAAQVLVNSQKALGAKKFRVSKLNSQDFAGNGSAKWASIILIWFDEAAEHGLEFKCACGAYFLVNWSAIDDVITCAKCGRKTKIEVCE